MEMQKGSKGNSVKELQQKLNSLGHSVGTADGIYGSMTEAGVKSFQSKHNLPVTGVVDYATLTKVNSVFNASSSSSRSVASNSGNPIMEKVMGAVDKIKSNKVLLGGVVVASLAGVFLVYRKVKK